MSWSNAAPKTSWSNVSPGVSWTNAPWSNASTPTWSDGGASGTGKTYWSNTSGVPSEGGKTYWSNVGGGGGSPTPVVKEIPTIYESGGTTLLREDYSKQGGGVYTTPIAGFQGGYGGSGFQVIAAAALSSPKIQKFLSTKPKVQAKVIKSYGGTEQDVMKTEMLQRGSAQFLSPEDLQKAAEGISGEYNPFSTFSGVILSSTPEERATEKGYYDITGKTFLEPVGTIIDPIVDATSGEMKLIEETGESPYPGMSNKSFNDFVFSRERTIGVDPVTGKVKDIVPIYKQISGKGIVNDQNQIMLTAKEIDKYNDSLKNQPDSIGSGITHYKLTESDKERRALIETIGEEKWKKATDIKQKRELEKEYREARQKSNVWSALTPLTSVDILGKTYTAAYETKFGSPEKAEQLRKEVLVAGEVRKAEIGGMIERKEHLRLGLDLFLQSPATVFIPIGVGAKIGTYALEKGLIYGATKIGAKGTAEFLAKDIAIGSGKFALKGTAVELGVGALFTGGIALDLAMSKSKGEAVGKIAVLGAGLPGAALGFKLPGKTVGLAKSGIFEAKEIAKITLGKAETSKFISEKTPDFLKPRIKSIVEKATRRPSISDINVKNLLTQPEKEIFAKLEGKPHLVTAKDVGIGEFGHRTTWAKEGSLIDRQLKLESGLKLQKYSESFPISEKLEPVDLSQTKYAGKIGKQVTEMIMRNPKDFVLGGSTAIPGVKGKDIDLYAINPSKTVEKVYIMASKEYPGSVMTVSSKTLKRTIEVSLKEAKKYAKEGEMVTFSQAKSEGGSSIIDVHPMSELGIGKPFNVPSFTHTKGVVLKPVKDTSGMYRISPREMLARKIEGVSALIESEAIGKTTGSASRRTKDVGHSETLIEQLRVDVSKKVSKSELEKFDKEVLQYKMYSGLPVEEYAYASVHRVIKENAALPLFLGTRPAPKVEKIEYYDVTGGKKTPSDYYPTQTKEVVKIVGTPYYPPTKPIKEKPSEYYPPSEKKTPSDYYPPIGKKEKPSEYYPPNVPYPRPILDKYWNEPLKSEIPRDEVKVLKMTKDGEYKEEKKMGKKLEEHKYKYRYRASPIFGGSEKLFIGEPKNPLEPTRKTQVKRKVVKPTKSKPEFDLGLAEMRNPIEKRNVIKSKKTNIKQKPFWEE